MRMRAFLLRMIRLSGNTLAASSFDTLSRLIEQRGRDHPPSTPGGEASPFAVSASSTRERKAVKENRLERAD